ncbi:LuxR C-terminal-related transcriptional regulator [Streptomyces microflavus]|uniref:LuxR C-terminal-related transcriptional regulator n=1 Tax=Streptomyces microflavus TaxID=1919 RepID=UPI0029B10904|nr:LuxR C-terminal-related transcriptional regulator [Streptomyces microflavus]MDX2403081.1 LuxR C-terminal-related transcriptional regulator [Streptomyces microflavus]
MCTTADANRADSIHELCEPAMSLYSTALREGRLPRTDLVLAPCLVHRGLVHPDPDDERWMRPVPASAALTRLLKPFAQEVFERLGTTAALVDALMPLTSIAGSEPPPAITVIEGQERVISALRDASRAARNEVLTAQPGGNRLAHNMRQGLTNARAVIAAGGRMRHLYQHPVRYNARFTEYLDQLPPGHLEVRTMEQAIDRLIVFDRKVAYIPAAPGNDTALEIRHPALVRYLVHVYEVLWAQATPYTQQLPTTAPGTPLTAVQHSIARLLAEGHVDEVVARKMGISVRTCRSHIAKLMQTLGATSRTHLGTLLARSGITSTSISPHEPPA